jgi:GNAT superfamily N-acetyltransferase
VARLDVGCYAVMGGDCRAPAARWLLETVEAPREIVYGSDPGWRDVILDTFGERVSDRPMRGFLTDALDPAKLRELAGRIPAGYASRPIDAALARQLDDGLLPHGLRTYPSPEELAAHGIGRGIVTADGELVSAATSYARSSQKVEVALSTRPDHRGRGLGEVVAAGLLLDCLERDLEPCWSAANPVSQRLALRLGYREGGVIEVLGLE